LGWQSAQLFSIILSLHFYIVVQRVNVTNVSKTLMGAKVIFVIQRTLD
jgi:hypothetical protein